MSYRHTTDTAPCDAGPATLSERIKARVGLFFARHDLIRWCALGILAVCGFSTVMAVVLGPFVLSCLYSGWWMSCYAAVGLPLIGWLVEVES